MADKLASIRTWPRTPVRILRQFDGDLLDIEQRDAGMMQQGLAGRRQRHAFGQPREQRDAESDSQNRSDAC